MYSCATNRARRTGIAADSFGLPNEKAQDPGAGTGRLPTKGGFRILPEHACATRNRAKPVAIDAALPSELGLEGVRGGVAGG